MTSAKFWTVAITLLLAGAGLASAQGTDTDSIQRVTVRDKKLLASRGGEYTVTTNVIKLPNSIVVSTNLTFRVAEGKERPLKDGQVLNADGTILNPDGTTHPVYDHLTMKRNRILVMRDGDYTPLTGTIELGDGARVTEDCYHQGRNGLRHRLQDGETFRLSGAVVDAQDTVTLLQGKVVVQKEGSSFTVARGSSLMMNDGTKVFGEGYLLKRDGARVPLTEGQTVPIEGIVVRR